MSLDRCTLPMVFENAVGLVPFADLQAQYRSIKSDVDLAIARVMETSGFILGEEVANFEREFAHFCGATEAVACGNGTDALELTLAALGVSDDSEVITVAHTFAATGEAVVRCGATPVFVDVDAGALLMDLDQVEAAITPRTRAIIAVHMYGNCVDMGALTTLADRHGIAVIEDAAQAHGARSGDAMAGAGGRAGCFSFYPAKNLGAYGDAGAVTTSDRVVAATIRQARDHGRTDKNLHQAIGRNSRMDGIQGAILRVKLAHLSEWNDRRNDIATRYRRGLADIRELQLPVTNATSHPAYHLFVVQVPKRDEFRAFLKESGVASGIHYPIPLHRQPAFANNSRVFRDSLPVTDDAAGKIVSLPMFADLTNAQVDRVIEVTRAAASNLWP